MPISVNPHASLFSNRRTAALWLEPRGSACAMRVLGRLNGSLEGPVALSIDKEASVPSARLSFVEAAEQMLWQDANRPRR